MTEQPRFDVLFDDDVYEFLDSIDAKARTKVLENIQTARYVIDPKLFKKLESTEVWEFRTRHAGKQYRVLAFWDKRQQALVITTNGFIKKTQKTPPKEIRKAEQKRQNYLNKK